MAVTPININNVLIKFRSDATKAFYRQSRFDPYTGTGINKIIRVVEDLESGGKQINVPLVDNLRGDGVSTGQLTGREEAIDNYGAPLFADWARHATAFLKSATKEASINIRTIASPLLQAWIKRKRRDDIIQGWLAVPSATEQAGRLTDPGNRVNGIPWGGNGGANGSALGTVTAATAAQKNLWATANDDRLVYGSLASNKITGNVSASMANITAAANRDKMSAAVGSLLKRTAQATTALASWPAITPYQTEGDDQEWFVCFMGSRAFRDLKNDPVMYQANRDARSREDGDPTKQNPLFTGGGLVYDGVIYKEIPEFDQLLLQLGVGAAGVDVAPVLLCGASAMAWVVGQNPQPTKRDETDYGFVTGIGIESQWGVGKIAKAPVGSAGAIGVLKDWGVVTGWVAAPPDA